MGGIAGTTVDQRSHIVGDLKRSKQVIGLADGGGQGVARVPRCADAGGILRSGVDAGGLGQLNAGGLAQAIGPGIPGQRLNADVDAHMVKKDIAGVPQSVAHRLHAMGRAVLAVEPAPELGTIVVHDAGVLDLGGGGDVPGLQSRRGRHHLIGGAGGIGTLERPVEEGAQAVIGLVIGHSRRVKRGPVGAGQHTAGVHIDRHCRTAAGAVVQLGDVLGQRVLCGGLQTAVQRQRHRVAGLGRDGVLYADDIALLVRSDRAFTGGTL